jgi:glycosyltransferase involved in cell wall biosynthesis
MVHGSIEHPRIAITHHWLTSSGGAEKVLYELHRLFPDAPIYTTAYNKKKFPELADADIRTTFLDKVPFLKYKHQFFPVFLGLPFKTLDMSQYDIVISSCAAEAKYVKTGPKTLHICYCHTPVRYYWSDYEWRLKNMPFGKLNWLAKFVYPALIRTLRHYDYQAAQNVDLFVANSQHIKRRIAQYYDRDSTVIYPGITLPAPRNTKPVRQDYYLIVGRQVASKRLDIAVEAFNILGLPLKVAGVGEELLRQRPLAHDNIEFLGRVSDAQRDTLMAQAKAFIFPPEEDFGMVPLESMAAGTPVIAYNSGGAPEYVTDGETGVLFNDQTPESLVEAVHRFEKMVFDPQQLKARAQDFDVANFRTNITAYVEAQWANFEPKEQ